MPDSTNDSPLNIDKIRSRANQKLQYQGQILPDDPVLSVLALNDALFQEYLETLKLSLIEAQARQDSAIQKQVDTVQSSLEHQLEKAAGYLKAEIDQAVVAGETRIQNTAQAEKAQLQQLTQLSYLGAACWFISGAITMGTILARLWLG